MTEARFIPLRDVERQRLLSAGCTFEASTGSPQALQRNGDGELYLFVIRGRKVGERSHWISATGWRIPMDCQAESSVMYWSNHFNRQVTNRFYLLTEFNWYHWTRSGGGGLPGVESLDLFNLGSRGVTGNDIVTQAVDVKFKPRRLFEIGVAWEFTLTERHDIIDNRINVNWIWRYWVDSIATIHGNETNEEGVVSEAIR